MIEGALAEEGEVAAEVEDFGDIGGGDVEVDGDFAVANHGVELMCVGEECLGEARARRGVQVVPEGAGGFVVAGGERLRLENDVGWGVLCFSQAEDCVHGMCRAGCSREQPA